MPELGNGTKTTAAVIGAVVALLLVVDKAMVQPMSQRVNYLQAEVARLEAGMKTEARRSSRVDEQSGRHRTELAQRFVEIETQFAWMGDIANMRSDHVERIQRLLWAEAFPGKDLPSIDYWPLARPDKDK